MATEEIERSPHRFWMRTCGVDTYRRGSTNARNDTPWNAFTQDGKTLVCSIWVDGVARVYDPLEQRERRFVRMGEKASIWKGPAVKHGKEARANLEAAMRAKARIVGFEVEPNPGALARGVRAVSHVYMNRAHDLQLLVGLGGRDLIDRLQLETQLRPRNGADLLDPGYLLELVAAQGAFPGGLDFADPQDDDGDGADGDLELDEDPKSIEAQARKVLRVLVAHVLQQQDILQPITYPEVAARIDRRKRNGEPFSLGLGAILGQVTALIARATSDGLPPAPFLTAVVVKSRGPEAGVPGVGVGGIWAGYEHLTFDEKQSKALAEYDRILAYGSRWNELLQRLGIAPVEPRDGPDRTASIDRKGGWGGGESEAHKTLKRFVATHPEMFGIAVGGATDTVEEYALRSADEIDVFFKTPQCWTGVEVKSAVSDGLESDYQRGLYQVVKYEALLRAQARIEHPSAPPQVRVLLVLERSLPEKYRAEAMNLGVEYHENIRVTE